MREFWLDIEKGQTYFSKVNGAVHVIEYSAFLNAATKCEEAQSELLSVKKENTELKSLFSVQLDILEQNKQMSTEIEQLKKENAELLAKSEYLNTEVHSCSNKCTRLHCVQRREIEKLKETLSFLPKVPTQPYEKQMAQEIDKLKSKLKVAVEFIDDCIYQHNDSDLKQYARIIKNQFSEFK
jgi:predicted RNase H-like nuclease (RuvC/YqgF family)